MEVPVLKCHVVLKIKYYADQYEDRNLAILPEYNDADYHCFLFQSEDDPYVYTRYQKTEDVFVNLLRGYPKTTEIYIGFTRSVLFFGIDTFEADGITENLQEMGFKNR